MNTPTMASRLWVMAMFDHGDVAEGWRLTDLALRRFWMHQYGEETGRSCYVYAEDDGSCQPGWSQVAAVVSGRIGPLASMLGAEPFDELHVHDGIAIVRWEDKVPSAMTEEGDAFVPIYNLVMRQTATGWVLAGNEGYIATMEWPPRLRPVDEVLRRTG